MIAMAGICLLGYAVTAIFGAGLETSGRALEGTEDGSLRPMEAAAATPVTEALGS